MQQPLKTKLFAIIQHLLPHHLLSRAVYYLATCRLSWLKNALIHALIKHYRINMRDALEERPEAYEHVNAFFTRALKPHARPLPADPQAIISPADGTISQIGTIHDGRLLQAKGHDYNVVELLGGDALLGQQFNGGAFATIYLAPPDYHRVHMPAAGQLRRMIHVPGRLFSVNHSTVAQVPHLFARNERVISLFTLNNPPAVPMAVIMVGAIHVASITTVWSGLVTPTSRRVSNHYYGASTDDRIVLARGDELGHFQFGSTVIVLLGHTDMTWQAQWQAGTTIKMGETLGCWPP